MMANFSIDSMIDRSSLVFMVLNKQLRLFSQNHSLGHLSLPKIYTYFKFLTWNYLADVDKNTLHYITLLKKNEEVIPLEIHHKR